MADVETIEDLIPEIDREFLVEKGFKFSARRFDSEVHVILHDFEFPEAYLPRTSDVLIVLPAGYPNANLDMFRTRPDVKLANGSWPDRAEPHVTYGNESWQQWSRHFKNPWRQGIDNLRTFVTSIRRELAKGV